MLSNLISRFITGRHHLIVDKEDVIETLEVINKHHKTTPDMCVGNCGWADDTNKWFIHFTTSDYRWDLIRKELNVVRVYANSDIPKDIIGAVYSTD